MADLSSAYLGLALKNPLVPSSSPLTGDLDSARRLEDAGAAAIVLPSLFEETILAEEERMARFLDDQSIGHGEADSFRPVPARFQGAEETYLNRLRQLKEALAIPVIASLNGATDGGWLSHAAALAEAGADALELNIYYLAGDPLDTAASVEARYLAIARSLVASMDLPVAVKLSSQFTAPLDLVQGLEREGVRACPCSIASTSRTSISRPWPLCRALPCRAPRKPSCACAGRPCCAAIRAAVSR